MLVIELWWIPQTVTALLDPLVPHQHDHQRTKFVSHIKIFPPPLTSYPGIETLVADVSALGIAIQASQDQFPEFEATSAEINQEINVGLKAPADLAVQSVNQLIESMDALYTAEQGKLAVTGLVAQCKGFGAVAGTHFDALHEQARTIMQKTTKVSIILCNT